MAEAGKKKKAVVYTLGYTDISLEDFISLLRQAGIQILVDLRSIPNSKKAPQFSQKILKEKLPAIGITYHHLKELGGKGSKSHYRSPNAGLPRGLQAYADYMLTDDFERGFMQLLALISLGRVAIFSSEADWNKCHRRLLADVLAVRGVKVNHLTTEGQVVEHMLSLGVEVKKDKVIYPAPGEQLNLF